MNGLGPTFMEAYILLRQGYLWISVLYFGQISPNHSVSLGDDSGGSMVIINLGITGSIV